MKKNTIDGLVVQTCLKNAMAGILPLMLIFLLSLTSCQSSGGDAAQAESKVNGQANANGQSNEQAAAKSNLNEVMLSELEFETVEGKRLAMVAGQPFSGIAKTSLSNGKTSTSQQYKDGLKNGQYEIYFGNGQLKTKGINIDGKEHGHYVEHYPSGQQKYEYHYNMGKKIKVWKSWYENGGAWTERHFENDKLEGKVHVWDEEGVLRKQYWYKGGALVKKELNLPEDE